MLKAVFYGIIQGITEWLPISSTGHMILAEQFIKLDVSKEFRSMFFVLIQLGSILAVIVLYFQKLNPFSKKLGKNHFRDTMTLWSKVVVGTIPAVVVGFFLEDFVDKYLSDNAIIVALMLIIYGVAFILIEKRNSKPTIKNFVQLDFKTALFIGMFQALALIPGTSRSGATILGAIMLGTSRYVAAEFSFFLAIPVMFGASTLKLVKHFSVLTGSNLGILLIGMIVAFVVSLFAIRFLMAYIKKHDFKSFGYYRIVLGIVVLIYFAVTGARV